MIVHTPETFRARPSCVLLDLDDTFYEYAPCHAAGAAEAKTLAGELLNLAAGDFDRLWAQARASVKAQLGPSASSHSRLLYFQRAIELAGLASQVGAALQLEQAYWRAFLDASRLFEGATEFLDDLRIARVPTVIVTDLTAQIQFRKMLHWRLDRLIDWIVTSEESGADKPAPNSYRLALEKVKPAPGPIWMISDEVKDLRGAKDTAGALGLLKLGRAGAAQTGPEIDAAFTSFDALREAFARIPA